MEGVKKIKILEVKLNIFIDAGKIRPENINAGKIPFFANISIFYVTIITCLYANIIMLQTY